MTDDDRQDDFWGSLTNATAPSAELRSLQEECKKLAVLIARNGERPRAGVLAPWAMWLCTWHAIGINVVLKASFAATSELERQRWINAADDVMDVFELLWGTEIFPRLMYGGMTGHWL